MSYFQRHIKSTQIVDPKVHHKPLQPYPLRTKNNNINNRIKTQYSIIDRQTSSKDQRKPHQNKKNYIQMKPPIKIPVRFQTERDRDVQFRQQPIDNIFAQADNSMSEMFNTSMKQFENYMKNRDKLSEQNHQLTEQNQNLRQVVSQLHEILKTKLQKALKKQEKELKGVMNDYLQLITKLLADKQDLTNILQTIQKDIQKSKKTVQFLQNQLEQSQKRQNQLSCQLGQLKNKYHKLNENNSNKDEQNIMDKLKTQNEKLQTLYKVLQRSENQKKIMQEAFNKFQSSDDRYKEIEEEYIVRLNQMEKEHQEQFLEYEKEVQIAIANKDEIIQRLGKVIEKNGLEMSMSSESRNSLIVR